MDWVRIRWILSDSVEWSQVMDRWMAEVILCGMDPGADPLRVGAGSLAGLHRGAAVTIAYTDAWLTVHQGDCREVLPTLPDASVDCVVTSPPYWGLRDYGTATWIGGDEAHAHIGTSLRTADVGGPKQQSKRGSIGVRSGDCLCGAVRQDSQLGLEKTPEEYVANLVAVFREVRRVLKPSGTVWLNLGDSYFGGGRGGNPDESGFRKQATNRGSLVAPTAVPQGAKPKDLVGIPWRVAFALQADGWYLRSDIIWAKPNPMPESVTDRPTKSHEYVFLLTRSARYFYDADVVREAYSEKTWFYDHVEPTKAAGAVGNNNGTGKSTLGIRDASANSGRNLRSVWTIATRPYAGAHFAVFPPELPERCIKAGSPENGGVVLDPFAGSGTVGMVANRLSRRAILIDLNPQYIDQQMVRNAQTPLGLSEPVA